MEDICRNVGSWGKEVSFGTWVWREQQMGKSNSITKAEIVISLQEMHIDCPNCETYDKWAEKRKTVEDYYPVLSSCLNSIFKLIFYYFDFWPTVFEAMRADTPRLFLGLHKGPRQTGLHMEMESRSSVSNGLSWDIQLLYEWQKDNIGFHSFSFYMPLRKCTTNQSS